MVEKSRLIFSLPGAPAALGLGLALFLAPWPGGSVRPAAFHLLGLLVAAAAAGLSGPGRNPLPKTALPFLAALVLLAAWALVQMIPLPAHWLTWLSPSAFRLYHRAATVTGSPLAWLPLSLAPALTQEEWVKLSTLALAFAASAQVAAEPRLRLALATVLLLTASLVAVLGLAEKAGGFLFGLVPERHHVGPAIGPFANRNHFADFIAAPALFGLGLVPGRAPAWRVLRISALMLLGLGLLASGSRAGLVAATGGALFYLFSSGSIKAGKAKIAAAAAMALFLAAFFADAPSARLIGLKQDFLAVRWPIWNSAFLVIGDFPWTGAGAGSFGIVEPAYSQLHLPVPALHAHCDYLEWLAEWGAPASAAAALGFGLGFLKLGQRRRQWDPIARAAAAGLVILFSHALAEFSLHIPAVALEAALLLGLAVSDPRAKSPQHQEVRASC